MAGRKTGKNNNIGKEARPLLPEVDATGLARNRNGYGAWFNSADAAGNSGGDATNYLGVIKDALQITAPVPPEVYAVPDMLRQNMDFGRRLLEDAAEVSCSALSEWLGTLCAIALAGDEVMREDVPLYTVDPETKRHVSIASDSGKPYFLRALAKNLSERREPVEQITLFFHRTNNAAMPKVPIAYSYAGMNVFLCPAARISEDISSHAKPWCGAVSDGREKRWMLGALRWDGAALRIDERLGKSVTKAEMNALYAGMQALVAPESAVRADLKAQIVAKILPLLKGEHTPELKAASLRTDLLPELEATGAVAEVNAVDTMVQSWFSEHLCIFERQDLDEETAKIVWPAEPRKEGSFAHCYGEYVVRDTEGRSSKYEALLPLNGLFAEHLCALGPEEAEMALRALEVRIIREEARENVPGSYLAELVWGGKVHRKQYPAAQVVGKTDIEKVVMPETVIWPPLEDTTGKWKDYYLYYAYGANGSLKDLSMRVLETDGAAVIERRSDPKANRNLTTVGRRSFVVRCAGFPKFIAVYDGGRQIGLLLAKPKGVVPGADQGGDVRTIGLDFGTSNSVAYFRNFKDERPRPFYLKSEVLAVAGVHDRDDAKRLTLDFVNIEELKSEIYPSLLHVHGGNEHTFSPFELTNVLFAQKINLLGRERNIHSNLKLSSDASVVAKIRALLKQVIMMYTWRSYCDGCSAISWLFSYPKSFSANQIDDFKTNIQSIMNDFLSPYSGERIGQFKGGKRMLVAAVHMQQGRIDFAL
ncbi:hypothetical protein FACS1894196_0680 [Clostridia bacterium]|nr:hypothetical protein FACS1894196_0680 [Clostridia bacterium]